jgi:hypothetical protein
LLEIEHAGALRAGRARDTRPQPRQQAVRKQPAAMAVVSP